ncbi:hypothetical protein BDW72DRAFT_210800 [Aspergillus terricola var. indicus]
MPSQTIIINYTPEGRLSLLDSATKQPLYHVKVSRQTPQMEMIRLTGHTEGPGDSAFPTDEETYFESRVCTAEFKMTRLDVKLRIREQRDVELKRKQVLSTSYSFVSPALSAAAARNGGLPTVLTWEADSNSWSIGNFSLLVDGSSEGSRKMLMHFTNEAMSTERVGTFEVDSELDQLVKDEAVISGLAMLSMNQSFRLSAMIMLGRS